MNAVEIEATLSELAAQPFNAKEFPFEFLAAFGNKETTLKRLRSGNSNTSDLPDGVLLRNSIHIAVCEENTVNTTLNLLAKSPTTSKAKAKFILATDGITLEAEDLISGDTLVCDFPKLADHFGLFLSLAGISTLKEIKDNPIDVRATGRLNKLYVALLDDNPEWALEDRRSDMNHFMARLIFCFFAEDTDIFEGDNQFTKTVDQVSDPDGSNTDLVLQTIFNAMNIKLAERANTKPRLPSWADSFPYVNGGLFSGSTAVPHFSRMSRTYLMHAGNLNWKQINPDIFGSMIQAVADDSERGALGMHYTSVPNILKVLNPLFLDDLRSQLVEASDNPRKLLNLRKRMGCIRVFDPACGSGNFLVIAYKQMREIEAEINHRRNEMQLKSVIPLTNFRGIEINDFPAEIARLALIIAEYQCDVQYRGQQDALAEFLPLSKENWIICGNALRLDWLSICPPTGTGVKVLGDDLFNTPLDQTEMDFANEGGETYICGNPPYLGSTWQSAEQKEDLKAIFDKRTKTWKSLDYVAGWFMKAADYGVHSNAAAAFVSTNSICQGQQVPILWPLIFNTGHEIAFAHTSFKWANLASHNAGVTVVIVGISINPKTERRLFSEKNTAANAPTLEVKKSENINAYLISGADIIIERLSKPLGQLAEMSFGNKPVDGGNLLLSKAEVNDLALSPEQHKRFIRRIYGSAELIRGLERYCLWVEDEHLNEALSIEAISKRIDGVRKMRLSSRDKSANEMAERAHQMREMNTGKLHSLVVPRVSSENRPYLPVGIVTGGTVIGDRNFALYDAPLWNMAIIASRLHWVWIGAVCVRLEMRFSYSNTLGWNTFPIPFLTANNKAELTACAENILLAREIHFPATIADLYDPEKMPENLRLAHEQNDEVLERIFIGRRFKNDTERLEKLFELYTKMIAAEKTKTGKKTKT